MKAVRFYGIRDVRFEQIPEPEPKLGEVRLKVLAAGICGSDLHIYRKGMFVRHIPETMGHEFIGIRQDTGEVVTANPMVPCMHCDSCRAGHYNTCDDLGFIGEVKQGCFADAICLPEDTLIPVLPSLPADPETVLPYVLTEPLAVAVNVMERCHFSADDNIAVFGAGPIGCLVTALAKQVCHAKVTVVDLSRERLFYAKRAGADETLCDGRTLPCAFHTAIDCAGSDKTVAMAAKAVMACGQLGIVSIFENPAAVDCNEIVNRQLTITGCNAYTQEDLFRAVELIRDGLDISFLITNRFSFNDCKKAFSLLDVDSRSSEKVVFLNT